MNNVLKQIEQNIKGNQGFDVDLDVRLGTSMLKKYSEDRLAFLLLLANSRGVSLRLADGSLDVGTVIALEEIASTDNSME